MRSTRKENEKASISKEKLVRATKIFTYIRPYRWYFIAGMVMLSASSLLFMVFPGAAGDMANVANGDDSRLGFTLPQFGLFFIVLLAFQGVFSYLRGGYSFLFITDRNK